MSVWREKGGNDHRFGVSRHLRMVCLGYEVINKSLLSLYRIEIRKVVVIGYVEI